MPFRDSTRFERSPVTHVGFRSSCSVQMRPHRANRIRALLENDLVESEDQLGEASLPARYP
jgi:hypothetical protein